MYCRACLTAASVDPQYSARLIGETATQQIIPLFHYSLLLQRYGIELYTIKPATDKKKQKTHTHTQRSQDKDPSKYTGVPLYLKY